MLQRRWARFRKWSLHRFGKAADVEGILFLIGLQELGRGAAPDLGKAARQEILLEGAYTVLETLGYYERVGVTRDGHSIWEPREPLPAEFTGKAEEHMLRKAVLCYLDKNHQEWINET